MTAVAKKPESFAAAEYLPELLHRIKRMFFHRRAEGRVREDRSWLENAIQEHTLKPFFKIVTQVTPTSGGRDFVSLSRFLDIDDEHDVPERELGRGSPEFVACLVALVQRATKLLVIDPYGAPSNRKFVETFKAVAARLDPGVRPDECEFIFDPGKLPPGRFGKLTQSKLYADAAAVDRELAGIGRKRTWTMIRSESSDSDPLHARFLVGDIEGIQSDAGFDSAPGKTVLTLMSETFVAEKRRHFLVELRRLSQSVSLP